MKSSVSNGRARPTVRLPILALIAGLTAPLLAGCPGALEGTWPQPINGGAGSGGASGTGTGGAGMACDAETKYLKNTTMPGCSAPGCHSGTFKPDLTTDPWGEMFTKNSTQGTCIGMPMIGPSKPASGTLFKRLSGTECGPFMPYLQAAPDPAALECITAWANSKLP